MPVILNANLLFLFSSIINVPSFPFSCSFSGFIISNNFFLPAHDAFVHFIPSLLCFYESFIYACFLSFFLHSALFKFHASVQKQNGCDFPVIDFVGASDLILGALCALKQRSFSFIQCNSTSASLKGWKKVETVEYSF